MAIVKAKDSKGYLVYNVYNAANDMLGSFAYYHAAVRFVLGV